MKIWNGKVNINPKTVTIMAIIYEEKKTKQNNPSAMHLNIWTAALAISYPKYWFVCRFKIGSIHTTIHFEQQNQENYEHK